MIANKQSSEQPEMFGPALERALTMRGCKAEPMQHGRLPHRHINGKDYTPPEFTVTVHFSAATSIDQVVSAVEKKVMEYVNTAHARRAFAGTAYVTIRDALRYPTMASVSISVLVV